MSTPNREMLLKNFLEKCLKIHGDKYDYSLVDYVNNKTKVKIICRKHGIFEQRPDGHIYNGCPSCSGNLKMTIGEFILRSNKKHQNRYDYSLVDYKNNNTKVKIVCQYHGVFEQVPKDHIRGKGCWKCKISFPKTTTDFLVDARNTHGDKYDYSKSVYKSALSKLIIICRKHGEFRQSPNKHLSLKHGCPRCKKSKGVNKICEILDNQGVMYQTEKTIKGCVSKNNRLLYFDVFIEDIKLAIEYDGEQHFRPVDKWGGEKSLQDIKSRDELKNKFCRSNDIKLVRISYKEDIEERMGEVISQYFSS